MVRIATGLEVEALHFELLLKEILATAEKLPPFPDVVWKVMPLIQKLAPVSQIEAVIRFDPVISARVLALSRSTYYARRHQVNSLQDAVTILGSQKLMQVILAACASRYFNKGMAKSDPTEQRLWEHSVATALTGEIIARHSAPKKTLKVYLAGLLHDIGKTVINTYAKIYLGAMPEEIAIGELDSLHAERSVLGVDHEVLGKAIAHRWRLPPEVITAIGYHHTPQIAPNHNDVAMIVYVANRIASTIHAVEGKEEEVAGLADDEIFVELGISAQATETLFGKMQEAMEGVSQFLTSEEIPSRNDNAYGRQTKRA